MTPPIHLRPITVENWKTCIALTVSDAQKDFVPSNLYSIAEAQFYPEARPYAIYAEDDSMVGFVLYGRDSFSGLWKVFRLMIDAAHQGKGYGRAAMEWVIAEIAKEPDSDEILICYQNPNQAARTLYTRLGFVEESIDEAGKVTARLKMSSRPAAS
jgi:diamine N-acetyltransferase